MLAIPRAVRAPLALALCGWPLAAQAVPKCDGMAACADVPTMLVTVTEFHPTLSGTPRMVSATIRFLNKSPRPLGLGYVDQSGVATDDRGNRFLVSGDGIRGIGLIGASSFDPRLTMQPGEARDGVFQFVWGTDAQGQPGSSWVIELVIREIDIIAGNQFKLGKEHILQFRGFKEGWVPTLPR